MLDIVFALSGSVVFFCLGLYLWMRPEAVFEKLKSFLGTYPLIRLAGENQHTSRTGYIRVLGVLFAILGALGPMSLIILKVL